MTSIEIEKTLEICKDQAADRLRSLLKLPPGHDCIDIKEFIDTLLAASLLEVSLMQAKVHELNNGG